MAHTDEHHDIAQAGLIVMAGVGIGLLIGAAVGILVGDIASSIILNFNFS